MLKLVKRLAYDKDYAYAPIQEDCVIRTEEIISVIVTDARGSGPFVRINLKDGTYLVCVGKPEDFIEV